MAIAHPAPAQGREVGPPPVPERALARLIDAFPALVAHVDATGRFLFANAAYERWLRIGGGSIRGRHMREVLGQAAYAVIEPHVEAVLRGERVSFAAELPSGEGAPRYVQATYIPDTDRDGYVPGFFAVVADPTDRRRDAEEDASALRRAETALENLRRRLGHHMENTPLALVEWDGEQRIRVWNRAAERLFGWRAEEVRGKRLEELPFIHEDDVEAVRRVVHELSTGVLDHHTRINRNYRRDGSVLHCEWHNSALPDENGNLVSVLSLASDVSERVRLEQELRKQAERLAEADRRKNEFLAMLGHELRSPLAPIRNAVEILSLSGGEPLTLDWVKQVVTRQMDHMVRLVNDLLDVARITRGSVELDRCSVSVADIVSNAIEANRDILHAKEHHFSLELPTDRVAVHADPIRMSQVIGNLLNNAAKYTPNGGHITLRTRQDGDQLLLEIEDDGVGIDPQDMPWIFDTFSQAQRSLDRSQGGLGLGLALARQIVALHGGSLEAKSDGIDLGSLFALRMPIVQSAATSPTEQPHPLESLDPGPKRVLVVDDQKDVADSLELLISVLGHRVRCVYDGMGVVDAVRDFHPQVVLLDLGLPGMDGYEVARRLGELPERKSMRVVAVSGYGQETFVERARAVGFDGYLLKPAQTEQIAELLGRG